MARRVSRSRAYRGGNDLRDMQELILELWRLHGPLVAHHIGDLPWRRYQHLGKLREVRLRLWYEGGATVAWGWLWHDQGALDFEVHPERLDLLPEVIAWANPRAVWTLDRRTELTEIITSLGYAPSDEPGYEHHVREIRGEIEDPRLPRGYTLRTVAAGDLTKRVEVHRSAFAPSRLVPRSYSLVMRAWPYRRDLDHVIEAPGGDFAAFCLAWLDEANGVGLLEPVGTHSAYRRQGLATAVCLGALRSLRAAGATRAIVNSRSGGAATRLYESIGMPSIARNVSFVRRDARSSLP